MSAFSPLHASSDSNPCPLSDPPPIPASFGSFESRWEEEQVRVPEGGLCELLHWGEDSDGVLSVWIHLHPDRQTYLQPWRHWWGLKGQMKAEAHEWQELTIKHKIQLESRRFRFFLSLFLRLLCLSLQFGSEPLSPRHPLRHTTTPSQ